MIVSRLTAFWTRHPGYRFLPLLATLLALFLLGPLLGSPFGKKVAVLLFYIVLLTAIETTLIRRPLRIATYVLMAIVVLLGWFLGPSSSALHQAAFLVLHIGFLVVVPVMLVVHVLRQEDVTADLIVGAICSYLLLGVLWAFLYEVLVRYDPAAFSTPDGSAPLVSDLMYFSFTTLTTLGYGDITPVSRYARTWSILEALTGQVYVAVLIARLVSQLGTKREQASE